MIKKAHKFKYWLPVFLIIGISVYNHYFFNSYISTTSSNPNSQIVNKVEMGNIHRRQFFKEGLFYLGVSKVKTAPSKLEFEPNKPIKGGIIPHHLYPSYILSDFFEKLKGQKPRTIILIGPNHYNKGENWVLTSDYAWDTPFGVVDSDIDLIDKLKQNTDLNLKLDPATMENEHSIGGIMPYIKYYLPKTKVVSLILKARTSLDQTQKLSKAISKISGDSDIVTIASVDFSHYLTASKAQIKDVETLKIIQGYQIKKLFKLNDDFLDSPASIATLLDLMQLSGTTDQTLLNHTNSGILAQDYVGETTSYFSFVFR